MITNLNLTGTGKFSQMGNDLKREMYTATNSRAAGMMLRRTTRGTCYVAKPQVSMPSMPVPQEQTPLVLRWL